MTGARYLALCGGVGGAKLAFGLSKVLAGSDLGIAVNVGDDFVHLGLQICPDIDTVLYTLSGQADRERGWGRAGETWSFMDALGGLGGDDWFQLGDRDLATHVLRTAMLREGRTLSDVTRALADAFGIGAGLFPASDQPLPTMIETPDGPLPFQQYFVRERCAPEVTGVGFPTAAAARPSPAFRDWLDASDLAGIILCPSNPYLSIDPILAIPGVADALRASRAPVVAISPIIGADAVKGPTAKIMNERGIACRPLSVAAHYRGLIDGFLVHDCDAGEIEPIEMLGIRARTAPILMRDDASKIELARHVVDMAGWLAGHQAL